ncbi:hypothetical protein ACTMSW_14970 [Micromonospora sp. BQ11]
MQIVDIVGLDVQADGGTHGAPTAQIGKGSGGQMEGKGRANRQVCAQLVE